MKRAAAVVGLTVLMLIGGQLLVTYDEHSRHLARQVYVWLWVHSPWLDGIDPPNRFSPQE